MGEALKRRLKQNADFANPAQEAMLNLIVAADHVSARLEKVCAEFGITRPQYNVLRILRGAHPTGHPRGELAARMVARAPDVTRLIDRLAAQGLVTRDQANNDRRQSIARITEQGIRLLEKMGPPIAAEHEHFGQKLTLRDCLELSRLCEAVYADEEPGREQLSPAET